MNDGLYGDMADATPVAVLGVAEVDSLTLADVFEEYHRPPALLRAHGGSWLLGFDVYDKLVELADLPALDRLLGRPVNLTFDSVLWYRPLRP